MILGVFYALCLVGFWASRNGCGGFIGFVTAPFRQPMFGSVRHGGFRHVAVLFGLSWCHSVGSQFSVVLVWLGLIPRIAILVLRVACSVALDFGPTRFGIICDGLGRVAARSVFFKYMGFFWCVWGVRVSIR